MARLPNPGGDSGNWGDILNDYLLQVHKADGTLKDDSVTSAQLADDAVTASAIADGSISQAQLDTGVRASLTKADSALQTAPVDSVNTRTGAITLTKTDVGLSSVDNTADSAKPVSTAQAAAIAAKPAAGAFTLSRPGALTVAGGSARLPIPFNCTLLGVRTSIGEAANAAVIVDVNRNGSSVFATGNDRPSITAGSFLSSQSPLSVAATAGDYLTVDVDQVGGVASPTFQAITSANGTNNGPYTLTRPAGAQVGDVHVAVLNIGVGGTIGSTTEPATVVTTPSGWTRIGSAGVRSVHNTTDRDRELHLFWWRDDGSQSSWTFSVTTPNSNSYPSVSVASYRGVLSSGSPVDAFATSSPAAGTVTMPTVTTTQTGDLLIGIIMAQANVTNPVLSADLVLRTPTSGSNIVIGDQIVSAAGATGTRTLSSGTWGSTPRAVTAMVALKSDPGATLPGSNLTVIVNYSVIS
jgi:hypothetical protein